MGTHASMANSYLATFILFASVDIWIYAASAGVCTRRKQGESSALILEEGNTLIFFGWAT